MPINNFAIALQKDNFYICKIASSVQSSNHPLYLFFRKQNYIFMTNARTHKSSFKCLKKEILLKFKMPL